MRGVGFRPLFNPARLKPVWRAWRPMRRAGSPRHNPPQPTAHFCFLRGVGPLASARMISMDRHKLASPQGTVTHDGNAIWMTPALLACGVLVIFLLFFRNPPKKTEQS
jgi:hypothetical protein